MRESLKYFKGVERRFNKIFSYNGADIYDDYAHHPTEIKEVINGVSNSFKNKNSMHFPTSRISRVNDLKKDFVHRLKKQIL